MAEGDTADPVDSGIATTETEPELGTLAGIVTDGIIGAVGGFAGTALMTVVFLVASTLGGFDLASFATTAELVGAEAVFGADLLVPIGYVIFLGGGMTTWPLLFASMALPTDPVSVLALFEELGAPERLSVLVEG